MENKKEEKEIIDKTTEKVLEVLGNSRPVKKIRRSQILTAIIGAVGFALFIDGISKFFVNFSAYSSLLIGFILMLTTGLLVKNLDR